MEKNLQKEIVKAVRDLMKSSDRVWLQEIKESDEKVCRVIHISEGQSSEESSVVIDQMLEEIQMGEMTIKDAAREIVGFHTEQLHPEVFHGITEFLAKQRILSCVIYQIIGIRDNEEYLMDKPYHKFLDLAVIYRLVLEADNKEIKSLVLTTAMCKKYSVSKEELDFAARKNTDALGFSVETTASILSKIGVSADVAKESQTWVCVTNLWVFGASILLYHEYFDKLADVLKTNLYLLPVSTHVLIIVPADSTMLQGLRKLVISGNKMISDKGNILSNNIYLYDRETHNISIA